MNESVVLSFSGWESWNVTDFEGCEGFLLGVFVWKYVLLMSDDVSRDEGIKIMYVGPVIQLQNFVV